VDAAPSAKKARRVSSMFNGHTSEGVTGPAGICGPEMTFPSGSAALRAPQSDLYLNLAPPSAASYISPPLMIEKEAIPFS
jgi:hypothetical protein